MLTAFIHIKAQYATINEILDRLEERKGINQDLSGLQLDDIKFVLVRDSADHTERNFVIFKGNNVTFVEVFDDKKTGESSSNVFSGDMVRSKKNIISIRCDKLEGKRIPLPVTKTFMLTTQKKIPYLIDINTKERWIDEKSFSQREK